MQCCLHKEIVILYISPVSGTMLQMGPHLDQMDWANYCLGDKGVRGVTERCPVARRDAPPTYHRRKAQGTWCQVIQEKGMSPHPNPQDMDYCSRQLFPSQQGRTLPPKNQPRLIFQKGTLSLRAGG